jgi:large subunit ribosomal protein L32
MAVPKKKTSQSRRNMRRAHDSLKPVNSVECSNCGVRKLPHHLCKACGHYNGRQVISFSSHETEGE